MVLIVIIFYGLLWQYNNIIFKLKTNKKYVYITIVYGMHADKQTNTYSHASMLHLRKMIPS